MMIKTSMFASTLAIALFALAPLYAAGIMNDDADSQNTRLPATSCVDVKESVNIRFETREDLLETLRGPIPVDEAVVEMIANKCESLIGQATYPSQLAHLLFELSYTDPLFNKLSASQIKNDLGYVMSNLGEGNCAFTEHLFAFYYGYTFEYYAPKKDL
jgi:hypothetical protein